MHCPETAPQAPLEQVAHTEPWKVLTHVPEAVAPEVVAGKLALAIVVAEQVDAAGPAVSIDMRESSVRTKTVTNRSRSSVARPADARVVRAVGVCIAGHIIKRNIRAVTNSQHVAFKAREGR